ncbi:MAG: GBS Bsp-like repeat-containing protein, partial [Lachnospiraceae bacterium]
PSGLDRVSVPVWCSSDQSDVYWYEAVKQVNGTFKTTVSIDKHSYATGIYNIHVYAINYNGVTAWNTETCEVIAPKMNIVVEDVEKTECSYQMRVHNAGIFGNVQSVKFAVWNEAGGSDDTIWYPGSKDTTGAWQATAWINNHKTSGLYYVHIYATLADNTERFIGTSSFSVTRPTVKNISVDNYDKDLGSFQVVVSGIASVSGIEKIQIPVWCASDQSDVVWYTAERQENGNYIANIEPMNHKNHSGFYSAHVYLYAGNGVKVLEGSTGQFVNAPSLYPIMGTSNTNVEQMVRYYQNHGGVYPSDVLISGGAGSLRTFCQIYLEEARAEGVKAEVAFTQAMKETGWLRFGGVVKIGQFNFCGLGATDHNGAVNSAWFPDVRTGIRAQIQHLKAYASTGMLNNACVDPRFHLVRRNCSPYVQWLGQKENPTGSGWATAKNYGFYVVNMIIVLKNS